MYSELQTIIQTALSESHYFESAAIVLENQPVTPEQVKRLEIAEGVVIMIGQPRVTKNGVFNLVQIPLGVSENQQTNSGEGRRPPAEVTTNLEIELADYRPSITWTPFKIQQFSQVFPNEMQAPWDLVISTSTIPIVAQDLVDENGDFLADESENTFRARP